MKTRAAILWQLHKPLVIDEIEIPVLKRGQVLVKILYSGICRAQYNEMIGLKGPDKFLPHLLGHEASGFVVDTAAGVSKVKKNDYVCLSWIKGQGLDAFNSQYKLGRHTINAGAVTTFSDYTVVSENRVVKILKKLLRTSPRSWDAPSRPDAVLSTIPLMRSRIHRWLFLAWEVLG